MPKLEISSATHTHSELATVLADFKASPLASFALLFGGYSCANYRVDLRDGSVYVLKLTTDYTPLQAERMCRTTAYLAVVNDEEETKPTEGGGGGGAGGFKDCCMPIPLLEATSDHHFVSLALTNGNAMATETTTSAFLVTYAEGRQADQVMRDRPDLACTVMQGIGAGLARMHATFASGAAGTNGVDDRNNETKKKAEELGLRWYQTDGGCCDLHEQRMGRIRRTIVDCKSVRDHPFVSFYERALAHLQTVMDEAEAATPGGLEIGITHGDPFADNVLVNAETGELSAFIDIEDICLGPLLFDLACCAIGCTFDDSPPSPDEQQINIPLLEALLRGYCSQRPLPPLERAYFVSFMKVALCCNCTWRFCKFNVRAEEEKNIIPDEAKNSYLELQRRIEYLSHPEIERKIMDVIASLLLR